MTGTYRVIHVFTSKENRSNLFVLTAQIRLHKNVTIDIIVQTKLSFFDTNNKVYNSLSIRKLVGKIKNTCDWL